MNRMHEVLQSFTESKFLLHQADLTALRRPNGPRHVRSSAHLVQWALALLLLIPGIGEARSFGSGSLSPQTIESSPPPVDLDLLSDFVDDVYARHGQAAFSTSVNIQARIASSVLSVADHHHRLTDRLGPGFEGHYLARRQPNPGLEFIDSPYFYDQEYTPDSPLKEMVVLEVSGEIGYTPLDYEAFVFRFVSPEGSCQIQLTDPVFPAVSDFSDDDLLALVFPDCEGPRATMEQALLEAVPGLTVTGFDSSTGTLLASSVESPADSGRSGSSKPGTPDNPGTGPNDGCRDYDVKQNYGYSVSKICSDSFFGYGNWVRGGSYWQKVICVPQGSGCKVQTSNTGDNLHSSIRRMGWGYCDCCDNYGADVFGKKNSAKLYADDGRSGGHVAIAKSPKSWRTSTGSSMEVLNLEGQCGGDMDLPHHGSTANASGSVDYTSKTETLMNKSAYGGWNADNITDHECLVDQEKPDPKTAVLID